MITDIDNAKATFGDQEFSLTRSIISPARKSLIATDASSEIGLTPSKQRSRVISNRNKNGYFARATMTARVSILALIAAAIWFAFATTSFAAPETPDEAAIRALLVDQTAAWNRGDIEGFMAGYWKSDETEFVSAEGISRGWQALLDRYKRSYPDRKAMGTLSFAKLEIHVECSTSAYAVGEYHLQREKDNPAGIFSLNLRKFPEGWRVVVDHTTAFPPSAAVSK